MVLFYVFLVLAVVIAITLVSCIVVVPQANSYVIERLGAYHETWETGIHVKLPFIERIAKRVSLKEQVIDFDPLLHDLPYFHYATSQVTLIPHVHVVHIP